MGPCMCGDLCCPSCGPAQGNSKCLVCGNWLSEGCENPAECEAKLPAAIERERLAVEAEAKEWAELDRLQPEIDRLLMGE